MKKNKGFSLVELIIVIAIMAILIGVLAPQYMKYVEKSRKTKDEDLAEQVYRMGVYILSDTDYYDEVTEGAYIKLSDSGITSNCDIITNKALPDFLPGYESAHLVSKAYKDQTYTVKFMGYNDEDDSGDKYKRALDDGWAIE